MVKTLIRGGELVLEDGILKGMSLVCADGRIAAIVPSGSAEEAAALDGAEVIDAGGLYVSPGFVDIHVHGGGGHDFMDGTVEAFLGAARMHAVHGTTTMLPTTLTSTDEVLLKTFELYREAQALNREGAQMAGLHLEGPYFSPEYAGAQDPRFLRTPASDNWMRIWDASDDIVRWSIAPELPGALDMGRFLASKGVLVSMAHTSASCWQAQEAFDAGFTLATHFYCAMSTITRDKGFRIPGVIEAGYLIDALNVEIIADGCHLPAPLLQMVYRFKGTDRTALCTDSMRAAGMPDGISILGNLAEGQEVLVEEGVARLMDRSAFAGSVCTADRLVRTMHSLSGATLAEAVKMASLVPARLAGLDSTRGSIAPGKDADIVIFDSNINIKSTIIKGNVIYGA